MGENIRLFRIADFPVKLIFKGKGRNGMQLLPSFLKFAVASENEVKEEMLFTLYVDDELKPIDKGRRHRVRTFDTGNGDTVVDRLDNGGYQFIIRDIDGCDCCLLIANKDFSDCQCALNGSFRMRNFGLNNALMLIFAFAGCSKGALLIHASLVRHAGKGYAFIAKSGTGKSTQVSSWLRYIPDCDLMNDDNPIVRVNGNDVFIYGSPWSGKTPCYRNVKAPLGALTRIDRAKVNSIDRLKPVEAFASVLPSCSSMKWDPDIFNHICDSVTRIVERIPVYTLHCLPDKEAALLCKDTIAR